VSGSEGKPMAGGKFMILDYILGGLVTLGLLVYLVYALLRPERF
jgi:K+-transporting ATPase KdpF subunit